MDRKWTYLLFAVGGVVLASLLMKVGDWAWGFYGTKSNDLLVDAVAIVIAGGAAAMALKNERLFVLATEVTGELAKVTWPTRKEIGAATIVVIVTCLVASIYLGFCDNVWKILTNLLFVGGGK